MYKLVAVNSFCYFIWKIMEDLTTDKNFSISQVSSDLLAAACFAILPDSQGNKVRKALTRDLDPEVIALIK